MNFLEIDCIYPLPLVSDFPERREPATTPAVSSWAVSLNHSFQKIPPDMRGKLQPTQDKILPIIKKYIDEKNLNSFFVGIQKQYPSEMPITWLNFNKEITNLPFSFQCHISRNRVDILLPLKVLSSGTDKSVKEKILITENGHKVFVQSRVKTKTKAGVLRPPAEINRAVSVLEKEFSLYNLLYRNNPEACPHYVNFVTEHSQKHRLLVPKFPQNLSDIIESDERNSLPAKALHIGLGVAELLHTLHSNNLNHGDLKPENICLTEKGRPVLIDFGSSEHINTTIAELGTFEYLAPELHGPLPHAATPAIDIWALGATLLYLTNEPFFHRLERLQAPFLKPNLSTIDSIEQLTIFKNQLETLLSKLPATHFNLLIKELLSFEPEKRPTAEQTIQRLRSLMTQ